MSLRLRLPNAVFARWSAIAASVAVMLGPWTATLAQSSAPSGTSALEEIVVTARKRSERLQQTPITVTAVTAEELDARNFSSITDLGASIPNISLTAGSTDVGGAANAVFFIRGIGQLDYAATADPGIGVYVDGVYLGRAQGAVMELADIKQVEILKGPQGTLFGKNTMGGALNITTKDPDRKFGGLVGITGGEDSRLNGDLELTGPVSETIAGRISAAYRSKDGFQKRPYAPDKDASGAEGTTVVRGKLSWTPSEHTTIMLAGDYTNMDAAANLTWVKENFNTWPPTLGNLITFWNALIGTAPGNTPYTAAVTSSDPRVDNGTYPNRLRFKGGGASLRGEWQLDPLLMRSISAYRTFDSRNQRDMDGSPLNFGYVDYRDHQWQLSQEFDFIGKAFEGRLDWTAGVYYFHEAAVSNWLVGLAPGLYQAIQSLPAAVLALGPYSCPNANPLTPCAGGAGNPVNLVFDTTSIYRPTVKTDSYAVFTELEWHFTDRLSAITGARYSHDWREFSFSKLGLGSGLMLIGPSEASKSWSDTSPRVGLKLQATPDVLYYLTLSKGYKAGGFTARPADTASARVPYDPEEVWAIEAGIKSDLLQRRLRLNAAAFAYRYRNLQMQANQVPPGGVSPVQYIDNIGKARVWGAESDLTFLATDRLTLYADVGYLNSRYLEASATLTGVGLDTPMPKAPKWSATGAIQYLQPLDAGSLMFRIEYAYASKMYNEARATEALATEAHGLLGGRLGWTATDGGWSVAAYGKNILDKKYVANGFDLTGPVGYTLAIPSAPRELGVQITRKF